MTREYFRTEVSKFGLSLEWMLGTVEQDQWFPEGSQTEQNLESRELNWAVLVLSAGSTHRGVGSVRREQGRADG